MDHPNVRTLLLTSVGLVMAGLVQGARADECFELARRFESTVSDTLVLENRVQSLLESATSCAALDDAIHEWKVGLEPRRRAVESLELRCKNYFYQGDQREIDAKMIDRKELRLVEYHAIRKKNVGCAE
jgi:hypothetical protein